MILSRVPLLNLQFTGPLSTSSVPRTDYDYKQAAICNPENGKHCTLFQWVGRPICQFRQRTQNYHYWNKPNSLLYRQATTACRTTLIAKIYSLHTDFRLICKHMDTFHGYLTDMDLSVGDSEHTIRNHTTTVHPPVKS